MDHTVERRRGKALEDAVLDAAWSELLDGGYASFTMEAVAARAHTSRPVLYRRWPNRADLAISDTAHPAPTSCESPRHGKSAWRSDRFAATILKRSRSVRSLFFFSNE